MAAEEDFEEAPPPPPDRHSRRPRGFEHFVRENPTAAVVGALVAGIMLGRLGIL